MVDERDISESADSIVRQFSPERIVLFGSYASGEPTEDSDVDLLIVMNHRGPSHQVATKIRQAIDISFPLDLLVRRSNDIATRIAQNDFFLAEVIEKGIVLYVADDARVGEQGRKRLRRRLAASPIA